MTQWQAILTLLTGSGAGALAHAIFAWFRANTRLNQWVVIEAAMPANHIQHVLAAIVGFVFYDRRTSTLTVSILGTLIAALAGLCLGLSTGASLSTVWASTCAFVVSQVVYAVKQSGLGASTLVLPDGQPHG